MFVLDTDHLGILQSQIQPEFGRLVLRMRAFSEMDFYLTIISFHEQVLGWNAYLNRAKSIEGVVRVYQMYERVLVDFTKRKVLPFDKMAASVFQALREQRVRIGTMDLRIASVALARGYTLLSRNLVDFEKVPGLTVEEWTRP